MDSSDFCAAFAPQTSQVHNATFQTRRPSMPRHAFRAANRLRRFFSASRILRRWPHGSLGVTRLNGKGSLTLRLTCLSDRASTVGSPLPPPVFLTDCRFLVSTNSFHFVSSIALLGAPKFPLFKGSRTPLQGIANPHSGKPKRGLKGHKTSLQGTMGHPHQVLQLLLDVLQEAALGEAALAGHALWTFRIRRH